MTIKLLNWFFVILLLAAAFILGIVSRQALAEGGGGAYDPFIARLEMLFNVHPGGSIPVDMRAPDIHLQYLSTRPVGHNCYEVNVCRYR